MVISQYPVGPNPHTLLTSFRMESKFFTVIDLCSTFFSLPVDPESQFLFSFTWKGQHFTWTVKSQSYTESILLFTDFKSQTWQMLLSHMNQSLAVC